MEAPTQITPTGLADYFEVLTKAVFQSGMSWSVIENKWDGFRAAFQGFDPETVGALTPEDVAALEEDTRIVRNKRKIRATVDNAQALLELESTTDGGFEAWLESRGDFEATVKELRRCFAYLGDFGAYYFLYVVRQPVPSHDEFRASRATAKA
jgi:3-methyladenine DNA glycosylase Tag